jgi:peroxiredoxin
MQTSRSLFQTAIKLDNPSANQPNGIKKHRPFLNLWSNSAPTSVEFARKQSTSSTPSSSEMASATNFFDFKPKDKKGQEYPLAQHKGKVVLAVNTASKCGFTPQFQGLETVWKDVQKKYPEDFVILGFPCNQFGGQDPGSDDQIQEFCQINYGVSFPVLGKTEVNGDKAEPVYAWMKNEKPGMLGLQRIKWNFEKFLIDRDGKVVNRWASTTKPESIEKDIISLIEKTKKQ